MFFTYAISSLQTLMDFHHTILGRYKDAGTMLGTALDVNVEYTPTVREILMNQFPMFQGPTKNASPQSVVDIIDKRIEHVRKRLQEV